MNFIVIDKRPDLKGKKMLSKNEEDKIKAFNEFTKKQLEAYNLFLGPNGAEKLLNVRKLGWTTIAEIDKIIDTQIAPHIEMTMTDIVNKIVNKYDTTSEEELK